MKINLILLCVFLISQTANAESWIVQLHKKNQSVNDHGFRQDIKQFKQTAVRGEKIQLAKDLSEPLPYKQRLPEASPVHDLVVLNASQAAIQTLLSEGKIISAEPDLQWKLFELNRHPVIHGPRNPGMPFYAPYKTNDSLWSLQWGLTQTHFDLVKRNFPMSVSQTAGKALVFVIDSWIDAVHEDLNINNFIDPMVTFDGTGVPSYHGTHVTGIMTATNNNDKGIAGALDSATIVPVEVCGNDDTCDESKIIQGLYYSADGLPGNNLPRVVNMSLGGNSFSYQTQAAVRYAQSKDVLIVAAAGNSATPGLGTYPASYPDVISVAASTPDYDLAYFSNYGANSVTLVAPGTDIASTIPADSANASDPYAPELINGTPYAYLDGTSMSTPFVTAAVALIRANYPHLPQYVVRQVLQNSAQSIRIDKFASGEIYKFLDANSALQLAQRTTVTGPRAANTNIASAQLDMDPAKSCYVSYNTSKPCENCIMVHGNVGHLDYPTSRIRWMVYHQIPSQPQPWWTTAVNSDGTFDDQIYYSLPNYDTDGARLLNAFDFLVGFIEDRDVSGEVRNLIPITFSDGSRQLDINRSPCFGNAN